MSSGIPCILFEDDHLLVINKPAGMNTHSASPHGSEGIYEWLRHREPKWAKLAIIHRLDKETSGVLVFSKTALANRSLTEQFSERIVRKKYLLLTDRPVSSGNITVTSAIARLGDKYVSRPLHAGGDRAETVFRVIRTISEGTLVQAEPVTGRTHQIRVHASDREFPISGDTLYGGSPAPRLCLHSEELTLKHPVDNREMRFHAPMDFSQDTNRALRAALIDPRETDVFRLLHGASSGTPGWYLDRLGDYLLSQADSPASEEQKLKLSQWAEQFSVKGVYHKILKREVGQTSVEQSSPALVCGQKAPETFFILENGVRYELSFNEGYSIGIFLDQRDNRRRFLTKHIAADFPLLGVAPGQPEVLNAFSYTCAFSVCAAKANARVTSLDLSKKYLDWGRRNFLLNGLDPEQHDFIYGDVFDWFRRLAKKNRSFDVIVLDPPTFSRSRESGVFQAEKNYGNLVGLALPILKRHGVILCSTNAAKLPAEHFIADIAEAVRLAGRKIDSQHYFPQPPDFPITRQEPGYLKTVWMRIA